MTFGERLREVRRAQNLSQGGLSQRSGIHPTAIGRFEHDRREPTLTSILRLADGLGVEPGELLDDLDSIRPSAS